METLTKSSFSSEEGGGWYIYEEEKGWCGDAIHYPGDKIMGEAQVNQENHDVELAYSNIGLWKIDLIGDGPMLLCVNGVKTFLSDPYGLMNLSSPQKTKLFLINVFT